MRRVRTAWPVVTRVQYIVAFEDCQRRWGLSARKVKATGEQWWLGHGVGRFESRGAPSR